MIVQPTVAEAQKLLDETPFCVEFNYRVMSLGEGEATIAVPYQPRHQRPGGILSGQVYMCSADVCLWLAIITRTGIDNVMAVTAEMTTAFLGSAREEEIICSATVLKFGKRLIYGTSACRALDGRLLTHHTMTYARPG
jgi:uncharacterized protein (TIGR00369 family)